MPTVAPSHADIHIRATRAARQTTLLSRAPARHGPKRSPVGRNAEQFVLSVSCSTPRWVRAATQVRKPKITTFCLFPGALPSQGPIPLICASVVPLANINIKRGRPKLDRSALRERSTALTQTCISGREKQKKKKSGRCALSVW